MEKDNEQEKMEQFADRVFENLRGMAVAKNLLRKPGEKRERDNRTLLEIRISAVPKAYTLQNEINQASKNGIYAVKHGENEEADKCIEEAKEAWNNLLSLPLPMHKLQPFISAAGQELVELIAVAYLFPAIRGNYEQAIANFGRLPLPNDEELKIPHEAWLAGLQDAITELGKLMQDILIKENPTLDEYEKIVTRTLELAQAMYDFLEKFENENKSTTDNSYHRGQGFKDKLRRIRIFIAERMQPLLMDIKLKKLSS